MVEHDHKDQQSKIYTFEFEMKEKEFILDNVMSWKWLQYSGFMR